MSSRNRFRLMLAIVAASSAAIIAVAQNAAHNGQWLIENSGTAGEVQLTLRYSHSSVGNSWNSIHSFSIPSSQLKGLDPAALSSGGKQGEFDLVRDAGTFHCEGWFDGGSGSGHFTFQANPQFATVLEQKGVGTPTADQQMRLAFANTSLEYVDVLHQSGYTFDVDDLIRTADHGVSLEYVRGMQQLGYKPATLNDVVRMRDHGVDPAYVKSLMAAGLGKMPAEEVVRMRDHGVSASYIDALGKYGIKNLSGEELANLRDHGVTPDYIAQMQALGANVTPQEMTRLRDHGVSAEYAAGIKKSGLQADVEDLMRMRDHGVSVDFVNDVRAAGIVSVTPEQLWRLRDHGVSATFIRDHGKGRSVDEIIRMHDRGETETSHLQY